MTDIGQLQKWYSATLEELKTGRQELSEAQQRVSDLEQKARSLESLLSIENALPDSYSETLGDHDDILISVVEDALHEKGGPMHLSDLREVLSENGVPVPGKGNDANLISRLQRSDGRIIRVGRGLYDIPRSRSEVKLLFPDGRSVELGKITQLGRSDENEIILADPEASRRHARIHVKDGTTAFIEDLGTVNGTLVNGRKVDRCELYNKDVVVIGATVLQVEIS